MLGIDVCSALRQQSIQLTQADSRIDAQAPAETVRCDITSAGNVRDLIFDTKPDWVVNCAAYTAVDKAEEDRDIAFLVNATGPANIAQAVKASGGRMLHVSTDYVFGAATSVDGRRRPFREDDMPHPCGIYGHSKRDGDDLVLSILADRALLLRTSWLHGIHGPNFVDTILKYSAERTELTVVDDQIGSPTFAGWLAGVISALIERDASGIFHATSRGGISWYDFAEGICARAGRVVTLIRQSTAELNRPAPRPAYSVLDTSKLENFLGEACWDWQRGLEEHLKARGIEA